MITDPTSPTAPPAPIADGTLIRIGAACAIAAGALRLPTSFIDPDATGAAVEALYYAIDISLLFTAFTAYAAVAASRTRLGTVGFAIASVGTGLLIGPEPADADLDYYAIGATAVTIGFATLAVAWRHSPVVSPTTRVAFLTTLGLGVASGLHPVVFVAAGLAFSWGLLQLGRDLLGAAQAGGEGPRPHLHDIST